MIRVALICLAVTGCGLKSEVVTTDSDRKNMGHIAVVSVLNKNMQCDHQGTLEYDLRRGNDKNLNAIKNVLFTQKLVDRLNSQNYMAKVVDEKYVTYTNKKTGASSWDNIKIDKDILKGVDTIMIVDGEFNFLSTSRIGFSLSVLPGRLWSTASLYLYDIKSGKLKGYKTRKIKNNSSSSLSCLQNKRLPNIIVKEIEEAGSIVHSQVLEVVMGWRTSESFLGGPSSWNDPKSWNDDDY